MKKLLIALLLWPAVAMAQYPVPRFPGSYPVPSSLTGSERIFATSGQNVINILPSQLSQYVASTAVFGGTALITLGPILGSQPGPSASALFNNNGVYIGNGNVNQFLQFPYGWGNTAAGMALNINGSPGAQAQVNGNGVPSSMFTANPALATVGLIVQSFSRSPMISAAATFDATHAYFSPALTPAQVAQLQVNMFIQTNDSPIVYAGMIASWAADGTSITITPSWYQSPPSSGTPTTGTPAGTVANINPTNTNYAANFVGGTNLAGHLHSNGLDFIDANVVEIDAENFATTYNSTTDTPSITGLSIKGTKPSDCGFCNFVSRGIDIYGGFYNAIEIHHAENEVLTYFPDDTDSNAARFLVSAQTNGQLLWGSGAFHGQGLFIPNAQSDSFPIQIGTSNLSWFTATGDGGLHLGQPTSAATISPYVDFNYKTQGAASYGSRIAMFTGSSDPTTTGGADMFWDARDIVLGNNNISGPTSATGYVYITGVSSMPTGTPALASGTRFPMAINSGDNKLCIYANGGWHDAMGGTGC